MAETKLIVGLGNPGKDYEYTRHNLGFLVALKIAENLNATFKLSSFTNGLTAEISDQNAEICLLMPLTYMNNSGVAVKTVAEKKEIDLSNVLVICDDLNLSFGQIRIRRKGSDGGHNGLSSIIERLGSDEFPRLRMGIDCPPKGCDAVDYVLKKFKPAEDKHLEQFVDLAVDCAQTWLKGGMSMAMENHNNKTI